MNSSILVHPAARNRLLLLLLVVLYACGFRSVVTFRVLEPGFGNVAPESRRVLFAFHTQPSLSQNRVGHCSNVTKCCKRRPCMYVQFRRPLFAPEEEPTEIRRSPWSWPFAATSSTNFPSNRNVLNTHDAFGGSESTSTGCLGLLMSEKRYKEQLAGKKWRSWGYSSVGRHYRIPGRGFGGPRIGKLTKVPLDPILLPKRRCMLLGKMDNSKARSISHSGIRTHRVQRLNLAWKRLWWPEGGHYVRLRLSMKGLKTIRKYGLHRAAQKFKLNLGKRHFFAGYAHKGIGGIEYERLMGKQEQGASVGSDRTAKRL